MSIKNFIEEIESDVTDVISTSFEYRETDIVPNRSDNQLTFERNIAKKGKLLKSCVLYVDIRNSVDLTQKHATQTMGRVYTAFTKAVIKTAKRHSGHIRNIIGDRVMVIFPSKNCFINAVDCAVTINHISKNIINKLFKDVDFKCGIGIDYGDLKVIKVGVQRRGYEGTENKSLVWIGYPANIASRLTDMANKSIQETYFLVEKRSINFGHFFGGSNLSGLFGMPNERPPLYSNTIQKLELSPEEFADSISQNTDGTLSIKSGKLVKFEKKVRSVSFPNILITDSVHRGLVQADPNRNSVLKNLWIEQPHAIKNVRNKVFGSDLSWTL